ncbi:hypothetical protein WDZ16_13000 [Pseudokineococcus marinus]|uniref:Terminase small subunit n=1 Tax=Pseudokineococcus marinus TaxID=351215 RepID=A0A849BLH4_9ACTN|nr:hypothetical protein [Pseudokineococcus marinus]NNH21652.1 hypothetical protein [Pseudokineococcus marinus]
MDGDDVEHDGGDVFSTAVARLAPQGRALYDELTATGTVTTARRLLVMEAARMVDRLEHLDRVLDGDGETWAQISLPAREGEPLVLQVGNAMVEARQTATGLRHLLGQLTTAAAGQDADEEAGGVDANEFTRRRQAREAAARGSAAPGAVDPAGR